MTPDVPAPGGAPALRLTVLIGEQDVWHHRPLYAEIVHRARAAGLAGASVFRGIEGFGAGSVVHTQRLLSLSEELPVAIVVVDAEERVRGFLPQLDELLAGGGLVTLDRCEMIAHRAPDAGGPDGGEGGRG
ncbi:MULTISPECIES: DUF190 domain-containing protein [Streptomyces]|uniref:DUF190 domain-containing protein n=1 Tax=Streptomyces TaxID=1883 RepID=UPI00052694EB|nr:MULTISPECIES: DUF190 domain-containing protein [Streptomyces]ARH93142.1 hypothetical protein STRMOE7_25885 [Streptomyces sp. MOE7]MDC7336955.1 DUF190 domain-containing protein [Streptomyces lydicus]UEG93685.1 DUF190 domain-containing protein [Streptomyces lydicus]